MLESPAKIHEILKIGEVKDFTVLSLESDEKLYLTMLDFSKAQQIQKSVMSRKSEDSESKEDQE
jgi:predicted RNA-binding protein with RPS1 domain